MTAKHDRMFIREYTAVENLPPLIVLDLPDRSFPVPDDRHRKAGKWRDRRDPERNPELRFGIPLYNFRGKHYRYHAGGNRPPAVHDAPADISTSSFPPASCLPVEGPGRHAGVHTGRTGVEAAWPKKDETGLFFAQNRTDLPEKSCRPYVPVFSTQVRRLLHSLELEEILLYSLFEGDLSHIREIALQAQMTADPAETKNRCRARMQQISFRSKKPSVQIPLRCIP